MSKIGTRIVETGTLVRSGEKVELRRDPGGRWSLDLHRVPTGLRKMRVRIVGVVVDDGLIDVDGIVAIGV